MGGRRGVAAVRRMWAQIVSVAFAVCWVALFNSPALGLVSKVPVWNWEQFGKRDLDVTLPADFD